MSDKVVNDDDRLAAGAVPPDIPERLSALIREGRLNWNGRRLVPPARRPKLRGDGATLSDIVLRARG